MVETEIGVGTEEVVAMAEVTVEVVDTAAGVVAMVGVMEEAVVTAAGVAVTAVGEDRPHHSADVHTTGDLPPHTEIEGILDPGAGLILPVSLPLHS